MPDVKETEEVVADNSLRVRLIKIAYRFSLIVLALLPIAALGTKIGLWSWKFGFGLMCLTIAPILIGLALLFALIVVGMGLFQRPRLTSWQGWIALLIPLCLVTYGNMLRKTAQSVPPIHDISTDMTNPPVFSAKLAASRGKGANTLDYEGKRIAAGAMKSPWTGRLVVEAQRAAYPDIQTISVNSLTPERAYRAALAAAESSSWRIGVTDPVNGHIEATDTSFWFGFTDDIAIRVSQSPEGGSLINMRSVSRVGMSDIGKNAARIRAYKKALEKEVKI
jgi:uncharacterized protein (DUF1499 family)